MAKKTEEQKAAEKAAREAKKAAQKPADAAPKESRNEKSDYASHPKFDKFKLSQGAK